MIQIYKNLGQGNRSVKFIEGCGKYGIGIISFYGCNFKCPFCFAQKYSYSTVKFPLDSQRRIEITSDELSNDVIEFLRKHPKICYVQLTGGEPILNDSRSEETIKSLSMLNREINKKVRIIYQTNGYTIGQKSELPSFFYELKKLENIEILFELSIKGTNEDEFAILSGIQNRQGFEFQLRSYWLLRNLEFHNINVVARLGTGHHRNTVHFINPITKKSLFCRKNWSSEFKEVFDDTTKRFKQNKMVSECINAEGDGAVNNYVHRSIPAIARCLDKGCLTSRKESKAILKASNSFILPSNVDELPKDYSDFLRDFEPMGDPAHNYCGRDEFKPQSRSDCPKECKYYPKKVI